MKSRLFHGMRILCVASILGLGVGARAKDDPRPQATGTNLPPCCRRAEAVAKPTDRSLYQLESEWTSDVGKKVRLGVFHGRPLVLVLFFTQCEYACPVLVSDLKRLQEALPGELRGAVDFALVSLDTARDTPEVLARYRAEHGLGTDHWSLLTGKADDVRELAALLGVNYRRDQRGQFSHSNVFTVLDAEGEVIQQTVGLNQDPRDAVRALSTARRVGKRTGP